jgi:hypothetical protein
MKLQWLSVIVLASLASARAGAEPPGPASGDKPTPGQVASPPKEEPAAKPARAQVELTPLGARKVEVSVGTELTFSFSQHGSVGRYAEHEEADPAVVRFSREDMKFHHPERVKAGMAGADAATGTYVFEAVAPGTATVTIRDMFRGTAENTYTFTVVVRAK